MHLCACQAAIQEMGRVQLSAWLHSPLNSSSCATISMQQLYAPQRCLRTHQSSLQMSELIRFNKSSFLLAACEGTAAHP